MKYLALILFAINLIGCTSQNIYERSAERIEEVDWQSSCCARTKEWVRIDARQGEVPDQNHAPDLRECVSTLKDNNGYANIPDTTAVIEIVLCMKEKGWNMEIMDLVITS